MSCRPLRPITRAPRGSLWTRNTERFAESCVSQRCAMYRSTYRMRGYVDDPVETCARLLRSELDAFVSEQAQARVDDVGVEEGASIMFDLA